MQMTVMQSSSLTKLQRAPLRKIRPHQAFSAVSTEGRGHTGDRILCFSHPLGGRRRPVEVPVNVALFSQGQPQTSHPEWSTHSPIRSEHQIGRVHVRFGHLPQNLFRFSLHSKASSRPGSSQAAPRRLGRAPIQRHYPPRDLGDAIVGPSLT